VVFRILVERRGDYIGVSQQFAGIKKTFHGLVVKPESTLMVVEVESTDVERRGDYIGVSQQFAGIKKTFHGLVVKPESTLMVVEVESTDVVKSTDVVESGETLNALEA